MLPDLRPPPPPRDDLRGVAILGSTGSIGEQTLEVASLFPDRLRIRALVAGTRWERLAEQAIAHRPRHVAIADPDAFGPLRDALAGTDTE
ncbi:MAG: hypothetical protein WBA11_12990, partial [Rubrivirga sp.]